MSSGKLWSSVKAARSVDHLQHMGELGHKGSLMSASMRHLSFWGSQLLGWGAFASISLVSYLPTSATCEWDHRIVGAGLSCGFSFLLWPVCRIAWSRSTDRLRSSVGCAGVGLILGTLSELITQASLTRVCKDDLLNSWSVLAEGIDYAVALACWALIYFAVKSYLDVRLRARQVMKAQELAREAQLRALRSQIQPHFLFNALNAVSSLLLIDRTDEAQLMLRSLSELILAMLKTGESHLTTMETELGFLENYLGIQRTRFGESLELRLSVGPGVRECSVPRWILIPLVENAVKYGLRDSIEGAPIELDFEVRGKTLRIYIANALNNTPRAGFGTGLKTTRSLLHAAYGERATLNARHEDNLFAVEILMPATRSVERDEEDAA